MNYYISTGTRKGLGKSLLLRYKSFLYRANHEDFIFIPAKGLTENASIRYNTFSKEHLLTYQKLPLWEDIWAFILPYIVCQAANIEINEAIKKQVAGNWETLRQMSSSPDYPTVCLALVEKGMIMIDCAAYYFRGMTIREEGQITRRWSK